MGDEFLLSSRIHRASGPRQSTPENGGGVRFYAKRNRFRAIASMFRAPPDAPPDLMRAVSAGTGSLAATDAYIRDHKSAHV